MLVSYNEIKHISYIHTDSNISPEVFNSKSNTESLLKRIGWIRDAAIEADYSICFVDTNSHNGAYAMPCNEKLGNKPSLVFFIHSDLCFEDIERSWRHEIVHINQLKTGRLSAYGEICYWEGKRYELLPLPPLSCSENNIGFADQVLDVLQYYAQPWELEAQSGNWNIKDPTFLLGKMLVDKYGTCWKNEWDAESRRKLIRTHGLKHAFRDLLSHS